MITRVACLCASLLPILALASCATSSVALTAAPLGQAEPEVSTPEPGDPADHTGVGVLRILGAVGSDAAANQPATPDEPPPACDPPAEPPPIASLAGVWNERGPDGAGCPARAVVGILDGRPTLSMTNCIYGEPDEVRDLRFADGAWTFSVVEAEGLGAISYRLQACGDGRLQGTVQGQDEPFPTPIWWER
jgi:hypothetical protein